MATVDIPIIKECHGTKTDAPEVDEPSTEAKKALELYSSNNQESNKDDPNTKTAHTKDESFNCSVEKEIIESEGSTIERTTTREEQVITQRQVKTTEESFQLTPEELFERFPELRGTLLNNTSQNTKSEFQVGGKGTLDDPNTMTASQEESRITSVTCPEDKDATCITINKSILTKHTAQGFSSSNSKEPKENQEEDDNNVPKGEMDSTEKQKENPSEEKTPTNSSSETVQATQDPTTKPSKQDKKNSKNDKVSKKFPGSNKACCTVS